MQVMYSFGGVFKQEECPDMLVLTMLRPDSALTCLDTALNAAE